MVAKYLYRDGSAMIVRLILVILGVMCVIDAVAFVQPMINNGDYKRVTRSMFVAATENAALKGCEPVGPMTLRGLLPTSSVALLAEAVFLMHKLVGADCVRTASLFWALTAIFWSGVAVAVRSLRGPAALLIGSVFAMDYFMSGFELKSAYEDAAVLALAPWLFAMIERFLRLGRRDGLFVIGGLLLYAKAQMVFLLPILAALLARDIAASAESVRRRVRAAVAVWLMLAAVSVGYPQIGGRALANSYNRFFNGIGWALQDVRAWPATTFSARHDYFGIHRQVLQQATVGLEPFENMPLFGTSFWPEGVTIYPRYGYSRLTSDDFAGFPGAVRDAMSLRSFTGLLSACPDCLFKYLVNTYSIAWCSDYNLAYIRQLGDEHRFYESCRRWLLRHAALVGLVIFLVGLWKTRSNRWRLALLYFVLGSPLFVVLGDGFYEFEKHLLPFVILAPAIGLSRLAPKQFVSACLAGCSR